MDTSARETVIGHGTETFSDKVLLQLMQEVVVDGDSRNGQWKSCDAN